MDYLDLIDESIVFKNYEDLIKESEENNYDDC